jgi:hypothetical protein
MWTPEPVWMMLRRENSLPYRDSNSHPSLFQAEASRYTDYAIHVHLQFKYSSNIYINSLKFLPKVTATQIHSLQNPFNCTQSVYSYSRKMNIAFGRTWFKSLTWHVLFSSVPSDGCRDIWKTSRLLPAPPAPTHSLNGVIGYRSEHQVHRNKILFPLIHLTCNWKKQ